MDSFNNYEFLIVDEFLKNIVQINSLITAFELNLIDYFIIKKSCSKIDIINNLDIPSKGLDILCNALLSHDVIYEQNGMLKLSKKFNTALNYRDLLEAKLKYIKMASSDFLKNFKDVIKHNFDFKYSDLSKFWIYVHGEDYSSKEYKSTKKWVDFISTHTKYDSAGCVYNYDFSKHEKILDVGGNSGEFALQISKRFKEVNINILDLPIVCSIGKERLDNTTTKINFIPLDMFIDDFPKGYNLITFKSTLVDWPDEKVNILLKKAHDSLEVGGKVLIYEACKDEFHSNDMLEKDLISLIFLSHFRNPEAYLEILNKIGFKDIHIKGIDKLGFMLIEAEK